VHPKPRNEVMQSGISSKHCSFIGITKVVIDSLSIVLQYHYFLVNIYNKNNQQGKDSITKKNSKNSKRIMV
jgi:hypothetical protein